MKGRLIGMFDVTQCKQVIKIATGEMKGANKNGKH